MQDINTPMMKQYLEIKKRYPDCLVLYRMGDFYELFMDDARTGSKVLDITLTSRSKGKDGHIPMAGVPYHAVDSYLSKLVKAGYKVAICEQMTAPNKKGIIEREVVRVVTPGTVLDEKALEKKENNFIISCAISEHTVGLAACDLSTGYFQANEIQYTNLSQTLSDELGRINPIECILSEETYNMPEILRLLTNEYAVNITCFKSWSTYESNAARQLKKHFSIASLESFGLSEKPNAIIAASTLLGYLKETQKEKISHITSIQIPETNEFLQMDRSTMLNLELFSTIRDHGTHGSLLSILDDTHTAMGGRLLRSWLKKPLVKHKDITDRYDAIDFFLDEIVLKDAVTKELEQIVDIERLFSRLSVGIGNARDLIHLKTSLSHIVQIQKILSSCNISYIKKAVQQLGKELIQIIHDIETTLIPEPPISIREGGMIQPKVNIRLDTLREIVGGSKEWITRLEIDERKKTGIGSLKVRFNKVFGFYIEVSRSNIPLVPSNYLRKQTLVNGERFITPELKKQEEIILLAEDEIHQLEYTIFSDLLLRVISFTKKIQQASQVIAMIDCIIGFSNISEKYRYVRPTLLHSGEIQIKQGRHPVVEQLLTDTQFVPNNVTLDTTSQQLLIITGPNMAGKSVFIRQIAIISLMAQIGCFVPAEEAMLSIVDRIFVRSGASDVITSGLSTFMVEMVETAYILNNATKQSLIIMDEIGRGTSTYDGISIAWAVAEYLVTHEKIPAKTLFATHYHELQELEHQYPNRIKNFHMAVVEENDSPVFLHTLMPEGASASFGISVAKLAGLPQIVIDKAKNILSEMEPKKHQILQSTEEQNNYSTSLGDHTIINELLSLDLHRLTPIEAINILDALQAKIKQEKS